MSEESAPVLWGVPLFVAIPALVAFVTTIVTNYWQGKRELRLLKSQVSLRAHESDYNRLLKSANDAPIFSAQWVIPGGSTEPKLDVQKVLDDLSAFDKWARVTLRPLLNSQRTEELDKILEELSAWKEDVLRARTSGNNIAPNPTETINAANKRTLTLITEQLDDLRKELVLP